ncbi:MAG TPA: hypothetical protein VFV38_04790, partial [Ktedonobacteraceae bacterium]|nr:hypothetical protein [Ktedonobacteraceae bacterium]
MSQGFSFNREFDFVRLDGLRRATGRPPHEWDLYIVKELVDNALDADDILWSRDASLFPRLEVRIEYIPLPEQQSQQLFIQVRNRSRFPVEQIDAIFATQWYTSRKGFIKGLTRGALGNALKTLLGIPYALRNRVAGDWSPELKPLSILCDGVEYLPRYEVDSQNQHIRFTCETRARKFEDGTLISIGIDSFEQEVPRTLRQIETFAQQYFLCNPYVQFQWTVEIEGLVWTQTFEPQPTWKGKFMGVAPVHWYSYSAFQDLLGALYREEQHEHHDTSKLSVEKICTYFGGFSGPPPYERNLENLSLTDIVQTVGKNSLTKAEIEGPV